MAPIISRTGGGGGFSWGFGRRRSVGPTGPFSATGGNVSALTPGNGYKYHTFTSPGTFTVAGSPGTIEVVAVGGGGGSDSIGSPGGGGGAVVYSTSVPISVGSYPVTVGYGGVSNTYSPNPLYVASGSSSVHSVTAPGGPGAADGGTGIRVPGEVKV